MGALLEKIDSPADLKRLKPEELFALAREIREEIIEVISVNGGHLAPSLGVVELTIALHYVFDAPRDRVIWDVGHQAYAHKLLTGRREEFHTIRQLGGLSGFPKRSESVFDAFGAGHSSTSISAGLGMSAAREATEGRVIAVIGDGALTGGMALEALNHAGALKKNLIIVLNDNKMSISPNVGVLSSFLSRKLTKQRYISFKNEVQSFLRTVPGIGENIIKLVRRSEASFRNFLSPRFLFEAFEFKYVGPIKGHRFDRLIEAFTNSKNLDGPVLVHVITEKGKGYRFAEENPTKFHGIGAFEVESGQAVGKKKDAPVSYTAAFAQKLVELAETDEQILAITAAMPEGTGTDLFRARFPERFFDVGIAEQHALTFAAGAAAEGRKPVVAIYSTFAQRGLDQIIHDIALQDLPVVLALDRGGVVGEDGPTHHGLFDLSFLRLIPGLSVMCPADEFELAQMLEFALALGKPAVLRYPRGAGLGRPLEPDAPPIEQGRARLLTQGADLAILAVGSMVAPALEAAQTLAGEGVSAAVVNARFVKPLDEELIVELAPKTGRILTVEENVISGGFGSAVAELLSARAVDGVRLRMLGVKDHFVPHGPQGELRRRLGLDPQGIAAAARELARGQD